jgi:hypothetical protein
MGREKLSELREDLKKIPGLIAKAESKVERQIQAVYQRFIDFGEEIQGHLGEFGQQLFGIHVIQEMILEKVKISPDEVKARIDAREAALAEQQRLLREASDKAHEAAEAEKTRQAADPAGNPELPEPPAGVPDGGNETSIGRAHPPD